MKLQNGIVAALALVGLAACNSNAGAEHAEAIAGLEKKMCACTDADCAKKVDAEVQAWVAQHKDAKVSQANFDKIKASGAKIVECAKKNGDADAEKLDDGMPTAE